MIKQTIREAIMDDSAIIPGYVYVVRDGDVIFYVGISRDPTFRLCQHLGIADGWNAYTYSRKRLIQDMENGADTSGFFGSQVGACILNNAPESLGWSFDIYEKEDTIAVIKRTNLAQAFPRMLEMMEVNWYEQRTIVENALIEELKPCLNSSNNAHERNIPEKYKSGVNLDDNAVDYIRL